MDIFSSEHLNSSFSESKQFFEENELTISQVSYDIRLLELLLKKYCLNFTSSCLVFNEVKIMTQSVNNDTDMANYIYEYVSWEVNEKENKASQRIFYKKYGLVGVIKKEKPLSNDISCINTPPPGSVLLERRPLVETPIAVRLKIYPCLPKFLKKITDTLSSSKPSLNFAQFQHSINEFRKRTER